MSETLVRANKVSVKADGDGGFLANFYRTHKLIGEVNSADTEWEKPDYVSNKVGERESFRQYVIEHASEYGINWLPTDMRSESNMRRPKYETDDVLIDDATKMIISELQALVEKCKYDIEWGGVTCDEVEPVYQTSLGRELSTLGITDGKYSSGNWAWANIKFSMTFKFKGSECYIPITMKLVSGQLKKTGLGIMAFNNLVKLEILDAELATEEELDPPKETVKKSKQKTLKLADTSAEIEIKVDDAKDEEEEIQYTQDDEDEHNKVIGYDFSYSEDEE